MAVHEGVLAHIIPAVVFRGEDFGLDEVATGRNVGIPTWKSSFTVRFKRSFSIRYSKERRVSPVHKNWELSEKLPSQPIKIVPARLI